MKWVTAPHLSTHFLFSDFGCLVRMIKPTSSAYPDGCVAIYDALGGLLGIFLSLKEAKTAIAKHYSNCEIVS